MMNYNLKIIDLFLKALPRMHLEDESLFCCEWLAKEGRAVFHPHKSIRYTIMALLGLERARYSGKSVQIDSKVTFDKQMTELDRHPMGGRGLLLWLNHRPNQPNSDDILGHLERELNHHPWDKLITVELAWILEAWCGPDIDF